MVLELQTKDMLVQTVAMLAVEEAVVPVLLVPQVAAIVQVTEELVLYQQ